MSCFDFGRQGQSKLYSAEAKALAWLDRSSDEDTDIENFHCGRFLTLVTSTSAAPLATFALVAGAFGGRPRLVTTGATAVATAAASEGEGARRAAEEPAGLPLVVEDVLIVLKRGSKGVGEEGG